MIAAPLPGRPSAQKRSEARFGGPAVVLFVVAPLIAVGLTLALLSEPAIIIGGMGAIVMAYAISRNVDCATYVVLFLVYGNLAVVAVKYHGVPSIAGQAVVGLLAIPLAHYLVIKRQPIVVGPAFAWAVLFGIVQLFGTIFASQPAVAYESLFTYLAEGLVLYLLITNVIRTPRALKGALWTMVAAGILMGSFSVIHQLTGVTAHEFGGLSQTGGEPGFRSGIDVIGEDKTQLRLAGPIGEKNRYAQVMLVLVPIGFALLQTTKSPILRAVALSGIAFAIAGTLLTFSRSVIVAAGIVLIVSAMLGFVCRRRVLLLVVVATLGLFATPQYRTRLLSLAEMGGLFVAGKHSHADGALKGRATEMGAAALAFLDRPVVGLGPGMFRHHSVEYGQRIGIRALAPERQAHSLPLDVAAENGFLGLFCLCAIFGVSGVSLFRAHRFTQDTHPELSRISAGLLIALVCYGATGLFLHFAFIRYFWLLIAVADAAATIAFRETHGVAERRTEVSQPTRLLAV